MSSWEILITLVVVFAVGLWSPLPYRSLLIKLRVQDISGTRSSHVGSAIRGGGLAPLTALTVGVVVCVLYSPSWKMFALIYGAIVVIMGVLGWIEDTRGLSVVHRAGAQIGVGLLGGYTLVRYFDSSWLWVIGAGLIIAAYVNTANFMDGINGISCLHGFVAGGTFVFLGTYYDREWLTVCGAVLAIAFVTFLPWNLSSSFFLGDVGSYALGAAVSVLSVASYLSGINPFVAVAPMSIYVVDAGLTFFRRLLRGDKWYESHREHIYQRLVPTYLSHIQGALLVNGGAAAITVFAVLMVETDSGFWAGVSFVAGLALAVSYLFSPMFCARLAKLRGTDG